MKNIYLSFFLLFLCINQSFAGQEADLQETVNSFNSCLSRTSKGKSSECVLQFYQTVQKYDDNTYVKQPALNYVRKMYGIFVRFDRGQITNEQDLTMEFMTIDQEFQSELLTAKRLAPPEKGPWDTFVDGLKDASATLNKSKQNSQSPSVTCTSRTFGNTTRTQCD